MKKTGKFLSFVLAISTIATTCISGTAYATTASPYIKSDTTMNFTIKQGATYVFKLTPINTTAKPTITTANSKVIQVVSSVKRGKDYFVKIKAVGAVGSCIGIYSKLNLAGQKPVRQLVVTIASQNAPGKPASSNSTTPTSKPATSTPSKPTSSTDTRTRGLYGIVETDDGSNITEVGVLEPISHPYNASYSFDQHSNAINKNMSACDLINGGFAKSGSGSGAFARFIEEDGKFGLRISGWRKSKSDNDLAGIYNGVLSAMVYLGGKDCGESLWAWFDAWSTSGGNVSTDNYGFKDDPGATASSGIVTFKSTGKKITMKYDSGTWTLLF